MCKFMSFENDNTVAEALNKAVSNPTGRTIQKELFLQPTEEGIFYRLRLLWVRDSSAQSRLQTPWIERYVHEVWEVDDEGKKRPATITCPTSLFARENWKGNPYEDCPICKYAGSKFSLYRESKDKKDITEYAKFSRKVELVVPVYIVSDPIYERNSGKVRVIRIRGKDTVERFKRLVTNTVSEKNVFNHRAVDCVLRVSDIVKESTNKNGKTSTFKTRDIVQMGFTNKPYDINITAEAVDALGLGDFLTPPGIPELHEWYQQYCLKTIEDDFEIEELNSEEAKTNSSSTTPPPPSSHETVSTPDFCSPKDSPDKNDITKDNDDVVCQKTTNETSSSDIDDLLNEIGI